MKSTVITRFAALLLTAAVAAPCYAGATLDSVPNYRRSSLYTFLVRSDAQDAKLDKEVTSSNILTSAIQSMQTERADTTETAGMTKSQIAQREFMLVEIPPQFNDHNLSERVLNFDNYKVTQEEIDAAAAAGNKGKKSSGNLLSMMAGTSSPATNTDDLDYRLPAVLLKFFAEQGTAPQLVAKWFGYNGTCYDDELTLIKERGLQDATEAAKSAAAGTRRSDARLMDAGQELIDNTFVLAVNLRYRSNAAIVEEAQQVANAVGGAFGSWGKLAAQVGGLAANAAAGKGFSVQAYTYLYKLEWDKEKLDLFYAQYWDKPLEQLINDGFCTLKFIGKDNATARVVASAFSTRPQAEMIKDAVENAIDKAIVKLQVKHEVFRTKTPLYQVSDDGKYVYAQIGAKEGVAKGDEYEVLEANEDENGVTTYKVVGKVKAVGDAIWNNIAGAAEDAKQLAADGDKKAEAQLSAINLRASKFEVKKGKDLYPGLLLRLSKKK